MIRAAIVLSALLLSGGVAESPVADAAQEGDTEQVRMLLRDGADVNAAQSDGMSAMHWASVNDAPDMIAVLAYAGANLEATTRLGGYTALHLAAREGSTNALAALVEAGADPHTLTTTGVTALHFAAASGRTTAIQSLLQGGASVDAPTAKDEQTPLMWATAANRIDAVTALLDAGADPLLTTTVVDYVEIAAKDGPERRLRSQLASVRRNAERAAQPPAPPTPAAPVQEEAAEEEAAEEEAAEEETAEEEAAEEETAEEAEEEGAEDEDAEDEDAEDEEEPAEEERPLGYNDLVGLEGGFTALHFAARDGRIEVARRLLERGAVLDQPTADGTTPLLMSVINGQFDLAMEFLDAGADPNLVAEDGAAPLFTVLNRRWGPKAAYPQPQAFTQQHTDYLDLLSALIEAGAEVNHRTGRHIWYTSFNFDQLGVNFAGATAFWRAAYATDLDAMHLLVAAGADPTITTRKVPSRRFGRGGNDEDKSGVPPVPTGGPAVYPIHAASGVGYGEGFAANSHSHAPDSWVASVRYLVEEHGADVNARDLNGYTPLHHAAARGDNELIEYLVAQGADVMVVSRRGETTVDMANGPRQRVSPFPETIALLESLGAINNDNCQSCQ